MSSLQGKIPMTVEGAEKIRETLSHLESEVRPKIIQDISEARAHGDLSENAEYHAAKERQGLVEARIADLAHKLQYAQIVDIKKLPKRDKVVFGATVSIVNINTEEKFTYKIVGVDEADANIAKISFSSPMGKALIGKASGDTTDVLTANGQVTYEILKIDYI